MSRFHPDIKGTGLITGFPCMCGVTVDIYENSIYNEILLWSELNTVNFLLT